MKKPYYVINPVETPGFKNERERLIYLGGYNRGAKEMDEYHKTDGRWRKRWRVLRRELRECQNNGGGMVISWGLPSVLRSMTEITRRIK